MVQKLIEGIRRFSRGGRESFLVVEDFGSGFVVTRAKTRAKDKKVIISDSNFAENLRDVKKPLFPVDKVIIALDSKKAFTAESVIHLTRNEPEEPIKETEIDALVFRGLWEFLNRYRGIASKKLGVHDLDLVLAGTEIREVFLGSYKVFNPLGFKGENLSFRYRGTFVSRSQKDSLEVAENWGREKIIIEGGGILGLSAPHPFEYFVLVRDKNTDIFLKEEERQIHLKSIPWGSGRILKKIGLLFGVDEEASLDILFYLNEKDPGGKVKRAIDKRVKEEIRGLMKLLPKSSSRSQKSSSGKKKAGIYLSFDLPFSFLEKLIGREVEFIDFRRLLIEQGYDVIIRHENEEFLNVGDTLAFVTHVYFPPQYGFLNNLLARRARWLTVKP